MEELILAPKVGAPIKYNPLMCETIFDVAKVGGHIPAMMLRLGIRSKDTWYRWQEEYPEFKEAVAFAKIISQAFHEHIGLQGAMGEIPNFNASTYALIMNNKFSDDYKRSSSGAGNTEITMNTINYTAEQINEKIAQKLEKLKSLGVDFNQEDV